MVSSQISVKTDKTPLSSSQMQVKSGDRFDSSKVADVKADAAVDKSTEVGKNPKIDKKPDASVLDNVPEKESESVSLSSLKEAISRVESSAGFSNSKISYEVDNATDKLVVKIIDKDTEEIIRQLPPKEMLSLAAKLEEVKGFILNEEG